MVLESIPDKLQGELPGHQPEAVVKAGRGCAAKVVAAGDACPRCQEGRLDYDGTLNLFCPACGEKFNSGGSFT